ncbi:MAG: CDP-alcohol phosphatidyltransferase family protein [Acutalibacteraceae bacterium]
MMRKYVANILTFCRILCSAALLFFPPLSPAFYVLYLTAGFTDMIDGTVARKLGTAGAFGAKLDTAADFLFFVSCLAKLFALLHIPIWLWIWIASIAAIKIFTAGFAFLKQRKFAAVHTVLNKITGLLLFVFPLTLSVIDPKKSLAVLCFAATMAAVQEGYCVLTKKSVE